MKNILLSLESSSSRLFSWRARVFFHVRWYGERARSIRWADDPQLPLWKDTFRTFAQWLLNNRFQVCIPCRTKHNLLNLSFRVERDSSSEDLNKQMCIACFELLNSSLESNEIIHLVAIDFAAVDMKFLQARRR